jgi:hypothetical protein
MADSLLEKHVGGEVVEKLKAHRKAIEEAQANMEGQAKSQNYGIPKPAQVAPAQIKDSTRRVLKGYRDTLGRGLTTKDLATLRQIDPNIGPEHLKEYE